MIKKCTMAEKGEGNGHNHREFNSVIDLAELMDLPISDHLFTWSNLQDTHVLARLDRVLVLADWDTIFSLASLRSLSRTTSDHVPFCLDISENLAPKSKIFHFEKMWLDNPGCVVVVKESWEALYLNWMLQMSSPPN